MLSIYFLRCIRLCMCREKNRKRTINKDFIKRMTSLHRIDYEIIKKIFVWQVGNDSKVLKMKRIDNCINCEKYGLCFSFKLIHTFYSLREFYGTVFLSKLHMLVTFPEILIILMNEKIRHL